MFKTYLERICSDFAVTRNSTPFKNSKMASSIRNDGPKILEDEAFIDPSRFIISGSPGKGQWSEVPWIAIYDNRITKSAMIGYYIVYLFRADGKGVYLSLNQGYTYFATTYKKLAYVNIQKVTEYAKRRLQSSNYFSTEPIILSSNKDLPKGYEYGHICGKYYPLNAIPEDRQLLNDLRNMMGVYSELTGYLGLRNDYKERIERILSLPLEEQTDEEDNEFQTRVDISVPKESPRVAQKRPDPVIQNGTERWVGDPGISKGRLKDAYFLCEIDKKHLTFISASSGDPYMEGHHLIPLNRQEQYAFDLDVSENIISLCPICHRFVHLGKIEHKIDILKIIFSAKAKGLERMEIPITWEKLSEIYS